MTQKTIDILNNLNKQFYDETGSVVWNQKPDYYWEGWYQLVSCISKKVAATTVSPLLAVSLFKPPSASLPPPLQVEILPAIPLSNINNTLYKCYKLLDLGCGNARFANFINSQLPAQQVQNIEYLGVDFSVNFLEQSQSENSHNFAKYELKQLDILKELDQLRGSKSDLVVMFGLIHHIPSLQIRKQFFKQVTELLNPNGLLIFTTWQYLDTPRLIKRVVDPETETGQYVYQRLGIKKTDLEVGDNILDWVKKVFSFRYSHYFSEAEISGYIADNNLELVHSFVCDGRDSKRNRYYVCRAC
jgi:tRNA (uracil-5-)-methyltransferase TRM9